MSVAKPDLRVVRAVVPLALALAACDASPGAQPSPAAAPAAPTAAGKAAPAAAPRGEATEPELADELFAESSQNRDPFRSSLADVVNPPPTNVDVLVQMAEYSLEELKLIGTVSGGAAPRAMFEDPQGAGVIVQRGDHISRSAARVTRILPSKVIVEIRKQRQGQKPEVSVREIELAPETAIQ